jgi:hypothetical protein
LGRSQGTPSPRQLSFWSSFCMCGVDDESFVSEPCTSEPLTLLDWDGPCPNATQNTEGASSECRDQLFGDPRHSLLPLLPRLHHACGFVNVLHPLFVHLSSSLCSASGFCTAQAQRQTRFHLIYHPYDSVAPATTPCTATILSFLPRLRAPLHQAKTTFRAHTTRSQHNLSGRGRISLRCLQPPKPHSPHSRSRRAQIASINHRTRNYKSRALRPAQTAFPRLSCRNHTRNHSGRLASILWRRLAPPSSRRKPFANRS